MQILVTVLIRLVLLAAGLVFAVSLAAVATLAIALWGLRYAWARLTGRPVVPFVVRIDPRAGFGRVYRRPEQGAAPRPAEPMRHQRPEIGDVTDVEPKPPRP
jgi:hypothetical protein